MLRRVGANPARMLAFGPFRLFPDRGLLLEEDAPVRIGSRALDILTALVERAGEVVSKEDLIERAWPNTIVVEANLRVHVAGLRKLLGDGQGGTHYIASVVGRGYRFIAPVANSFGSGTVHCVDARYGARHEPACTVDAHGRACRRRG